MKALLLLVLLALAYPILVPLKPNRPRCLSEYLIGATASTIKLKIAFPKLDGLQPGEHFTVSLRNTESQVVATQVVQPGEKYSREEPLDQNVIYEICMTLKAERELEPLVDYLAESVFAHDHKEVRVPESLLTKGDMQDAFRSASYLASTLAEYAQEQRQRAQADSSVFLETERLNGRLTVLSGLELAVVVVAGAYQFFTLRNYLSCKQYI